MRSERWSTIEEIDGLVRSQDKESAGPVLYVKNGVRYTYNREPHICVIGRTGTGKSQCGSLPFVRETLLKRESLVIIDPKGEVYRKTACYVPDDYNLYCIDFRKPRQSPTRYNPLLAPYKLYNSGIPEDRDRACSMVSDLVESMYPVSKEDPFWDLSARNYVRGLIYTVFDYAPIEKANFDSISSLMEQAEMRSSGGELKINALYKHEKNNSLARRCLTGYAVAPDRTRTSISSVAAPGMEMYSRSKGVMQLLANDDIDICNLDPTIPAAVYIILPDETNTYDPIGATFITQLYEKLINTAQDFPDAKLPVRWNFVLEELGSLGQALPTLPNMLTAARSRNIRLMLILQSYSQLEDLYGRSNTETIMSCLGITIGFATSNWDTLREWSQRCGEREIEFEGTHRTEPLITPAQLAAMPIGMALILIENRYKFISHIPFFDEVFDNSDWKEPAVSESDVHDDPIQTVTIDEMIDAAAHDRLNVNDADRKTPDTKKHTASTAAGRETDAQSNKVRVVSTGNGISGKQTIAIALTKYLSISITEALVMLSRLPTTISFNSKEDARDFLRILLENGGDGSLA